MAGFSGAAVPSDMDSAGLGSVTAVKRLALLLLAAALGCVPDANAQTSIIDRLLQLQESVVEIETVGVKLYKDGSQTFFDPKTRRFYKLNSARAVGQTGNAAGIVIDPTGIIVTNAHVAYRKGVVTVKLSGGGAYPARLLYASPQNDFVFLKIENLTTDLPAVPLGDSDTIGLRDRIFTIGSSEGLKNTLTEGVVTGLGQNSTRDSVTHEVLQMNFNVYEGDSGSPVFNERGELIGMITASRRKQGRTSYAISSNVIKQHLPRAGD